MTQLSMPLEQATTHSPALIEFHEYLRTELGNKAWQFDQENMQIYHLVIEFATQARAAGHTRFSINSIFERIRWKTNVETNDKTFKISNNHRAYYARKVMAYAMGFDGFFQTNEPPGRHIQEHGQ